MILIRALHTRRAYEEAGYRTEYKGRLYHKERAKYAAVPVGEDQYCLRKLVPEEYDEVFGTGAYCATFGFRVRSGSRIYSDDNTDSAFDLTDYRFISIKKPEFERIFGPGSYNMVQRKHAGEWLKSAIGIGYDEQDR